MNLIKIGDTIINLDNVTHAGRENGIVYVGFSDRSTLEFFGKEGEALWDRLVAIEKGGRV